MTDDLFFDTDCLSAFLWINDTNILHELYGGRIVLPEPVYQELSNPCIPHIGQRTDLLLVCLLYTSQRRAGAMDELSLGDQPVYKAERFNLSGEWRDAFIVR